MRHREDSLCVCVCVCRTSGKLLMLTIMSWGDFMEIWPSWLRGNFPSPVVTTMWSSAPVTHTHTHTLYFISPWCSLTRSRVWFASVHLLLELGCSSALIFITGEVEVEVRRLRQVWWTPAAPALHLPPSLRRLHRRTRGGLVLLLFFIFPSGSGGSKQADGGDEDQRTPSSASAPAELSPQRFNYVITMVL